MNKKHKRIVASVVLRAWEIPNHYVYVYTKGLHITFVISVNNYLYVYTVVLLDKDYIQCNCPLAERGNICKHAVKVFKMLHLVISDGYIVRVVVTLHDSIATGTNCTIIDSFGTGRLLQGSRIEEQKL